MIHNSHNLKIVFFGTPDFAVVVLEELKTAGIMPTLIVTAPDKPRGRKLVLTPPPVKEWAEKNSIDVAQPAKLKDEVFLGELQSTQPEASHASGWDLFLVASYGKIIPKSILDLPKHGTLNVHPSLLPKLRGPSPIQSSILEDEKETGVSIMLLDQKIDHGPILAQARVALEEWPPKASVLKNILAHEGGVLLAEVIPEWVKGTITPLEQDHSNATYSVILKKEDGLIDLTDNPYKNFLKIQAYDEWPGAYFFVERKGRAVTTKKGPALMRVKITDASFENDALTIKRVVPEGKREMNYDDFLRG